MPTTLMNKSFWVLAVLMMSLLVACYDDTADTDTTAENAMETEEIDKKDDEKEESKIRGKDVASRGKELSQRKQKAIERAKEYISKAAKSKELSARDMHLALHHAVFDPECEECLGGQQRRAPHSRKGASNALVLR